MQTTQKTNNYSLNLDKKQKPYITFYYNVTKKGENINLKFTMSRMQAMEVSSIINSASKAESLEEINKLTEYAKNVIEVQDEDLELTNETYLEILVGTLESEFFRNIVCKKSNKNKNRNGFRKTPKRII